MLAVYIFLLLTGIYGWVIHFFKRNWEAIPMPTGLGPEGDADSLHQSNLQVSTAADTSNKTNPTLSIIIPARNEEKNIAVLLQALQQQKISRQKPEIIVVDDHSEDNTAAIAASFPGVKVLSLQENKINSYKKKAIERGVQAASGELIVCTDADCVPGHAWVSSILNFYEEKQAAFIAAPVLLTNDGSWLGRFQTLDFMILQGITGAGIQSGQIYMANGANLAYPKKVFEEVEGYRGADRLASGDDLFLLHKIVSRYPHNIAYLKSPQAIVRTEAMQKGADFLQQRIRWASKSAHYKDFRLVILLMLVWFYNAYFMVWATVSFFDLRLLIVLIAGWLLKTLVEWPFVQTVSSFFRIPISFVGFACWQPFHILYTVLTGLLGLVGRYEWKGRVVR